MITRQELEFVRGGYMNFQLGPGTWSSSHRYGVDHPKSVNALHINMSKVDGHDYHKSPADRTAYSLCYYLGHSGG